MKKAKRKQGKRMRRLHSRLRLWESTQNHRYTDDIKDGGQEEEGVNDADNGATKGSSR